MSSTSDVCLVDTESLEAKGFWTGDGSNILSAYIFAAQTASFASGEEGAILVLCQAGKSKTTHLRILSIDEADSILQKHEWDLPVDSKVCAMSVASSEHVDLQIFCRPLPAFRVVKQELWEF